MITFDYNDIFEFNGGEYYSQSDEDYNRLSHHFAHIIGTAMQRLTTDTVAQDAWTNALNEPRYHSSTIGLGKQSIMDSLGQLLRQLHHPKSKRYSIKQIVRFNNIMNDLEKLSAKILKDEGVWNNLKVQMTQKGDRKNDPLKKHFEGI